LWKAAGSRRRQQAVVGGRKVVVGGRKVVVGGRKVVVGGTKVKLSSGPSISM